MAKKPAAPEQYQTEQRPIADVIPYERNPRVNDQAVDAVARSIQDYGFQQPIVVDSAGVVVVGHTRLKAAVKLGLETVPVHVATDLTPEQAKAYRLADNKTGELAIWDLDLLGVEITELDGLGVDVTGLGFDEIDLAGLLNTGLEDGDAGGSEGQTDPDATPEVPEEAKSERGVVYLLGRHRVMCGDSTNAEDVGLLMGGERAGLMNTDPPYGVAYANEERPNPGVAKPRVAKPRVAKPRVANDTLADSQLQDFLESSFKAAVDSALVDNAAWYLWHAHLTQGFFAAAAAANVILHRQIIWVKPVLLLGRGMYHWKHEPCFMGWVEGKRPPDYGLGDGERTQTTIWEVGSITQAERKDFNHPTPKPVELFAIPITKHLKDGEICYEPFAGSGPQFIAAEKTNRRCYGLEIEPRYVDVIRRRWAEFVHGEGCDWESLTPAEQK